MQPSPAICITFSSPWTSTFFSARRFINSGRNVSAIFSWMTSDSHALHTPILCVLAFNIISIAISKSTKIWQFPVPVSMTGIVAWFTTALISPAPPLGISTSTYSFIFIKAAAVSLDVSSIKAITCSGSPSFTSALRIVSTIAILEWIASLPPFKITTFPVLKQRANASAVTFGLAS